MNIINWILYIPLALCVCYLLVYAVASKFYRAPCFPEARKLRRFVILFPAYKEDRVIISSVRSFLQQDYPQELFDIIVISDQMQDTTNDALRSLPIRLLIADYKESSKAKAMTMAMNAIKEEPYDVVAVMDADNLTSPDFLAEVNRAFDSGLQSIQAHRTGKNLNTAISVLDGISEEINNGIFRSGHNVLGLSAALSGSGMAFDAHWFRQNVAHLQTAGEDKELEALLLRQRIYIDYLDDLMVLDEKVQGEGAYYNQRRRWIAAQFYALGSALRDLPGALLRGNYDYVDKLVQWCLPPRMLLIGLVPLWAVAMTFLDPWGSVKWWAAWLLLLFAMAMALPDEQTDAKLGHALRRVPVLVLLTAANLFRLGGTRDKFIHTRHTGASDAAPEKTDSIP